MWGHTQSSSHIIIIGNDVLICVWCFLHVFCFHTCRSAETGRFSLAIQQFSFLSAEEDHHENGILLNLERTIRNSHFFKSMKTKNTEMTASCKWFPILQHCWFLKVWTTNEREQEQKQMTYRLLVAALLCLSRVHALDGSTGLWGNMWIQCMHRMNELHMLHLNLMTLHRIYAAITTT